MINRIICLFRAVYYFAYERIRLKIARELFWRRKDRDDRNPLISIYCPTYNRKDILLTRAVYSVLRQTYANWEFIILGDCCTDGTGELLQQQANDPRIKFYNLKKRGRRYPPTRDNHWFAGPVVASNAALKLCRGEWIARIDDDDIWTRDHLQKLLSKAEKERAEFVSSAYVEERKGVRNTIHPPAGYVGGTSSWLYRSYLRFFRYNIDCWRKKYDRVNDLDLQKRMISAGVRMAYVKEPTYYLLPRPGEETIGSDVYRNSAGILEHYDFK